MRVALLALGMVVFVMLALMSLSVAAVLALPDVPPAQAALAVGAVHALLAWVTLLYLRRSWRALCDRSVARACLLGWRVVRTFLRTCQGVE